MSGLVHNDALPQLHEKVVYPGHGVAQVIRIIEKKVADSIARFYELKFLNKDMTILVPVHSFTTIGIRRLSSVENIDVMFKILAEPVKKIPTEGLITNWNKRSKKYLTEMRTGNLLDICRIYRDLKHISSYKELSFGEKNLLAQTEALLAQEISLVKNVEEDKAIENLRAIFKSAANRNMLLNSL